MCERGDLNLLEILLEISEITAIEKLRKWRQKKALFIFMHMKETKLSAHAAKLFMGAVVLFTFAKTTKVLIDNRVSNVS